MCEDAAKHQQAGIAPERALLQVDSTFVHGDWVRGSINNAEVFMPCPQRLEQTLLSMSWRGGRLEGCRVPGSWKRL